MPYFKHHLLTPDEQVLDTLADLVWTVTKEEQRSPLVILSTSGPAYSLRQALEKHRPPGLPSNLMFLPRVLGLAQWLKETPGLKAEGIQKTDLERWYEVYRALSDRPQLSSLLMDSSDASKWSLAKKIIEVCDLLSDATLGVFDEVLESALSDAIAEVYQGASKQIVEVEARIVLAFWENLSSAQDPIVRQRRAMGLRIAELKNSNADVQHTNTHFPIIFIQTAQASPGFEKALEQVWQAHASVTAFHHCSLNYSNVALWPECLSEVDDSKPMIQKNRDHFFESGKHLSQSDRRILKAQDFEDAAWQGAGAIEKLLQDGHHHIALIAQDRLVARRMRALLARFGDGLSVHDETGWKLSTTRAAASVMSWMDVVRHPAGPSSVELIDFLKNPYIDWSTFGITHDQASDCLTFLEQRLIEGDVRGTWSGFILALDSDNDETNTLVSIIRKLKNQSNRWQAASNSCLAWLDLLEQDLIDLGMSAGLAQDIAGQQLLASLSPMRLLRHHPMKQVEWLSLLSSMLEDASYIESNPRQSASVTILPLSATRLRRFDAWVMVGCDDTQLPSLSDSPMFLSAQLKKLLGCKTQEAEFIQQAMDLSQLMRSHQHWRMIWQSVGTTGEPRQPSPWLQRLYVRHPELLKDKLEVPTTSYEAMPISQPRPSLPGDFVKPTSISPSAYRALRECPYRYYVTRLLGLKERSGLEAEVDLSLVGKTLHAALYDFYHGLKTQALENDNIYERTKLLKQRLYAISHKHFKPLLEVDGRWLAAWIEWETLIPSWIDWHIQREQSGWVFHDGEKQVSFDLQTRFGDIRVSGFVDRLDIHPQEGVEVIDYKFSSKNSITKKKNNLQDDPQLVIYAKAVNEHDMVNRQPTTTASWISVKEDDSRVEVDDLQSEMKELPAQMIADIESLWGGSPMAASAPDSICQYCQARGICRKGMWS
jgi:ATP-dependent helicase/nuclease subunit B